MAENQNNANNYSASNIQVLEGLEAVRNVRRCILVTSPKRVFITW